MLDSLDAVVANVFRFLLISSVKSRISCNASLSSSGRSAVSRSLGIESEFNSLIVNVDDCRFDKAVSRDGGGVVGLITGVG